MEQIELIATSTFGLESVVKRELEQLGYSIHSVDNGKVTFFGTHRDIIITNLWLRTADRILWKIGEFPARTFDELYDKTKKLRWPTIIPKNGTIIVNGKSVKSKLFSVSDCQSIVKKAIVDKLMFAHKTHWLKETAEKYSIQVSLLKDIATIKDGNSPHPAC